MYRDTYGLNVSCASQAALDAYLAGLNAAMTLDDSGIAVLENVLELDPEFALAHALLARQCLIHGRHQRIGPQLELAERHAGKATAWEQSSLAVTIAMLRHQPQTLDLALAHARENPRDVTVLMHIVGPFGLLAASGYRDWRQRVAAIAEDLQPHYSADDWWLQATLGFSYAETGDLDKALSCSERAWQLDENGSSGHAIAHTHFEQTAIDTGLAFLDEWLAKLEHASDMRHHMQWHRALLLLEAGMTSDLIDLFQDQLIPRNDGTPPLDMLSDNASLLWRLMLHGLDVPQALWAQTFEFAEANFSELGFAFADLHRILATAMQAKQQRRHLQQALKEQSTPFLSSCATAFNAFADGDYAGVAESLENCVDDALFVAGSNPQRRVVRETYEEAVRRSRQNA